MRRYLAAFDTPSDRRRRQLVRALNTCGERVQESVFVLQVTPAGLGWLGRRLREIVTPEDDLLVFAISEPQLWWSSRPLPEWPGEQVL